MERSEPVGEIADIGEAVAIHQKHVIRIPTIREVSPKDVIEGNHRDREDQNRDHPFQNGTIARFIFAGDHQGHADEDKCPMEDDRIKPAKGEDRIITCSGEINEIGEAGD